MIKNFLLAATILVFLGSWIPAGAQNAKQVNTTAAKSDVKFLDDISIESPASNVSDPKAVFSEPLFVSKKSGPKAISQGIIENASGLQFKYALLLDLEVEQVINLNLFKNIDEWMGVRYRLGGSTKDGIDCSALMQLLFSSTYGLSLPRTAREQYNFTKKKISRTELKEGDLVFFNTIGGVSHVGMYLQNNKFVHASSAGVTISDLYEEYWLKHFVGAGRMETNQSTAGLSAKP